MTLEIDLMLRKPLGIRDVPFERQAVPRQNDTDF